MTEGLSADTRLWKLHLAVSYVNLKGLYSLIQTMNSNVHHENQIAIDV